MVQKKMVNTRNKKLIVLVLLTLVLVTAVSAAPTYVLKSRSLVGNVFNNAGSLLINNQSSAFVKLLDFFIFFAIFASVAMIGLKNWGGDKVKGPRNMIAIAFGLALSVALVWGTNISVATLFPFASFFLVIVLYIFFFKLFANLGMTSTFWKLLLALVLTIFTIYFFIGFDELDLPDKFGKSIDIFQGKGADITITTEKEAEKITEGKKGEEEVKGEQYRQFLHNIECEGVPVGKYILELAKDKEVPHPCIIYGLMMAESNCKIDDTSSSGYSGLMAIPGSMYSGLRDNYKGQIEAGWNILLSKDRTLQSIAGYTETEDRWKFAVAGYNIGQAPVKDVLKRLDKLTWENFVKSIRTTDLDKYDIYKDENIVNSGFYKSKKFSSGEEYRQYKIRDEMIKHHQRTFNYAHKCFSGIEAGESITPPVVKEKEKEEAKTEIEETKLTKEQLEANLHKHCNNIKGNYTEWTFSQWLGCGRLLNNAIKE